MDEAARKRFGIDYPLPDVTDRQTVYTYGREPRLMGTHGWQKVVCFLAGVVVGMAALALLQ